MGIYGKEKVDTAAKSALCHPMKIPVLRILFLVLLILYLKSGNSFGTAARYIYVYRYSPMPWSKQCF